MALTKERAEAFLYQEAQYADEHRFDEWLALWAERDVTYWIPLNHDDVDPASHISIAYDNTRALLEERINRLKSRGMHSQQPRSRLRRLISNVAVTRDEGGQARVEANFLIAETRAGRQSTYAGRFFHDLRYDEQSILIVGKKALLINNDESIGNMTFLV